MKKNKELILVSLFFGGIFFLIFWNNKFNNFQINFNEIFILGKNYLGIFFIPTIFVIILDILFSLIFKGKLKLLLKTRIFFWILVVITVTSVFILFSLEQNSILTEENIIKFSLLKHNFGFLLTYFVLEIFELCPLKNIYIIAFLILLVSSFFLFGKEVSIFCKYLKKRSDMKKAKKLEEALCKELSRKVELKDELEKQRSLEYAKEKVKFNNLVNEKIKNVKKNNTYSKKD